MPSLKQRLIAGLITQFKQPRGLLGRLAGTIMAKRASNIERNRWALEQLQLHPQDRLLEIGFGPGVAALMAHRKIDQGHYYGIDHSHTMFQQASARNRKALKARRMTLMVGDICTDVPPPDWNFNKVFSTNVVQFWPDPVAVFKRLYQRLPPGGSVATAYQPRQRGATDKDAQAMAEKLSEQLTQAGFKQIMTTTLNIKPACICVVATR